jgi:phosphatidylglycerophosphate synthase
MNPLLAAAILIGAAVLSVSAMLAVRRRAPDGGYFADGDRAAGVFGVLATGFSIVLGFVIVLAFTSYDASRSGAEEEALLVVQQIETAQFMPTDAGGRMTGDLVCYARSVIGTEWPAMERGELGEHVNEWAAELFRTFRTVDPQTPSAQAAYGKWMDQTSDRESARSSRIHGAVGVVPWPLWIMLFLATTLVMAYMLFFADSGERAVVQGFMIGSVACVITAMLLVLWTLDNPFHPGMGGLRPVAMERTLDVIEQELAVVGDDQPLPCATDGTRA